MKNAFEKARDFIYRNARPLDLARWQYYFENGSPQAVLAALTCYQNEDGGFGHGLEPDYWNPHSTPIATWAATEHIRELDFSDANHPIVSGILQYLESGADFNPDANQWLNVVPSNNEYPSSCWWKYGEDGSEFQYNPSAALAGFLIRYAAPNSALYEKGVRIAREAFAFLKNNAPWDDAHITACFVSLYEYCLRAKADILDMEEFKRLLIRQVNHVICRDAEKWFSQYQPKPSEFVKTRDSIFLGGNESLVKQECEMILAHQEEDGGFPVLWNWATEYQAEFAVSANWWKSCFVIDHMRFLREFRANDLNKLS